MLNETVSQSVDQAGTAGTNALLNINWTQPVADFVNSLIGADIVSPDTITWLLPAISIILLYWKWNSLMTFLHTSGQTVLILVIVFIGLKIAGVL